MQNKILYTYIIYNMDYISKLKEEDKQKEKKKQYKYKEVFENPPTKKKNKVIKVKSKPQMI